MKIAITGTNGLLGQHLVNLLLQAGYEIVALGKGSDRTSFSSNPLYNYYEADITQPKALREVLAEEEPDFLVHGAAMTQVDECELNRDQCEKVNVHGTANALFAAADSCHHIIYVSTDFVFDGVKGNYSEGDEARPVSYYGQTKLEAETIVQNAKIPWTIVRTCLVYGNALTGTRNNIVSWVKQSLEQGKNIKVVNDQIRTPTYVEDLAKGMLLIIQKGATGIFHISGKDVLTPFEMAIQTARYFGLNEELIEEVNGSVFTQPANRPPKTGFNILKAREELGYEPLSFAEGLCNMFKK